MAGEFDEPPIWQKAIGQKVATARPPAPKPAPVIHGGIEVAPGVFVHPDNLRLHYARSSGPGGQNVNKVATKADLRVSLGDLVGLSADALQRLRHLAGRHLNLEGELHFVSEATRSQERNRQAAIDMLRELILRAKTVPKIRRKTKPSRGARERRLGEKRVRSEVKRMRRPSPD